MGKLIRQSVFSGVILPFCAAMTAVACADEVLQSQIDEVTPKMYFDYLKGGPTDKAALQRLDAAFDKVLREVRETVVTDKPAIWFVYNMGVVVKTKESCFSIDLQHRKAPEIAPFLDFALITHRHGDHFTEEFYRAMDGAGKTVISNFKDNAGAMSRQAECGLTKGNRTFKLKDVEIRTALADHSKSKVDFTTTFEIRIGGLLLFHSGDCSDVSKLNPSRSPDLWLVHPYCGMKTEDGVKKFSPKLTAILHLNELGHARTGCRWTWEAGLKAKAKVEEAGGVAVVPVWGDRICKSVRGSERIGCAGAGNAPPSPAKRRKSHQRRSRAVRTGIGTADRAISIGPSSGGPTSRRT